MRQINPAAQQVTTGVRAVAGRQPLQNQAEIQFDDGADDGDFFDAEMDARQASGELVQGGAHVRRGRLEVVEALCAGGLQRGGQCTRTHYA